MDNKLPSAPKASYPGTDKLVYKKTGISLMLKASIAILVVAVLALGGAIAYKQVLNGQIESFSESLERAKAAFDPVLIAEIEGLITDTSIVKGLLVEHKLPTRIFDVLEETTTDEVYFKEFSYAFEAPQSQSGGGGQTQGGDEEEQAIISLEGEAKSYIAIGRQAKIYENNDKIESFLFSDFETTDEGTVSFSLDINFSSDIYK